MPSNKNSLIASTRSGRNRRRNKRASRDSPGAFVNDAWALSKRALKGVNALRRLINTEYKICDTTGTASTMSQGGALAHLTAIAQGTNISERVGDSLKTQHIEFRGHVFINVAALFSSYRVVIFRDLENTGSAPVGSDLLKQAGTANAPTSPYTYVNNTIGDVPNRFTILYDEMGVVCNNGQENAILEYTSSLTQHVRYSGTAGGNTREGALYLAIFSSEAVNPPSMTWDIRLWYTDD